MSQSIIGIEEIEQLILCQLDPPDIINMREVNTYYVIQTQALADQFTAVKYDLTSALDKNFEWIIKWHLKIIRDSAQKLIRRESRPALKESMIQNLFSRYEHIAQAQCSIPLMKLLVELAHIHKLTFCNLTNQNFFYLCDSNKPQLEFLMYVVNVLQQDGCSFYEAFLSKELVYKRAIEISNTDILTYIHSLMPSDNFPHRHKDILFDKIVKSFGVGDGDRLRIMYNILTSVSDLTDSQRDLIKEKLHMNNEDAFRSACYKNNMPMIQFLTELANNEYGPIDLHAEDDYGLYFCIRNENADMFDFLHTLYVQSYGKDNFRDCLEQCLHHMVMCKRNLEPIKFLFDCAEKYEIAIDIHARNEYVFRMYCIYFDVSDIKCILDLGEKSGRKINIHANDEEAFRIACILNNIPVINLLLELGLTSYGPIDIHAKSESAFQMACGTHNKQLAEFLLRLGDELYGPIDIHAHNEYAFRYVCYHGLFDMAQWLMDLSIQLGNKIDLHVMNDVIFRSVCERRHVELAKWLCQIGCEPIDDYRYKWMNKRLLTIK